MPKPINTGINTASAAVSTGIANSGLGFGSRMALHTANAVARGAAKTTASAGSYILNNTEGGKQITQGIQASRNSASQNPFTMSFGSNSSASYSKPVSVDDPLNFLFLTDTEVEEDKNAFVKSQLSSLTRTSNAEQIATIEDTIAKNDDSKKLITKFKTFMDNKNNTRKIEIVTEKLDDWSKLDSLAKKFHPNSYVKPDEGPKKAIEKLKADYIAVNRDGSSTNQAIVTAIETQADAKKIITDTETERRNVLRPPPPPKPGSGPAPVTKEGIEASIFLKDSGLTAESFAKQIGFPDMSTDEIIAKLKSVFKKFTSGQLQPAEKQLQPAQGGGGGDDKFDEAALKFLNDNSATVDPAIVKADGVFKEYEESPPEAKESVLKSAGLGDFLNALKASASAAYNSDFANKASSSARNMFNKLSSSGSGTDASASSGSGSGTGSGSGGEEGAEQVKGSPLIPESMQGYFSLENLSPQVLAGKIAVSVALNVASMLAEKKIKEFIEKAKEFGKAIYPGLKMLNDSGEQLAAKLQEPPVQEKLKQIYDFLQKVSSGMGSIAAAGLNTLAMGLDKVQQKTVETVVSAILYKVAAEQTAILAEADIRRNISVDWDKKLSQTMSKYPELPQLLEILKIQDPEEFQKAIVQKAQEIAEARKNGTSAAPSGSAADQIGDLVGANQPVKVGGKRRHTRKELKNHVNQKNKIHYQIGGSIKDFKDSTLNPYKIINNIYTHTRKMSKVSKTSKNNNNNNNNKNKNKNKKMTHKRH